MGSLETHGDIFACSFQMELFYLIVLKIKTSLGGSSCGFKASLKGPRAKILHLYVNFLPSGYGKPKTAAEVIVATTAP